MCGELNNGKQTTQEILKIPEFLFFYISFSDEAKHVNFVNVSCLFHIPSYTIYIILSIK